MKKKDIITLVISILVMGVSIFFLWGMLFPKAPATSNTNNTQQTAVKNEFTGNIDNDTLDQIKKLNDYGEAPLDNIGRVNPFGPLN
jgi:hypothetical protein